MRYIIFLLVFLIQYLWDRINSYCLTIKGEILLILHHIVSIYVLLGGILFNSKYHLIFIIIILIHWLTNNNSCYLTTITNKFCGYNKEKNFEDLIYKLNFRKLNKNIHYYLLIILIFYDIYYLIK